MNRWLVAGIAALCTTGAYRLYSTIMAPLTVPRSTVEMLSPEVHTDFRPRLFQKAAEEYFADVPWTREAVIQSQRDETFLLFSRKADRNPAGDGRTIKFSPIAILWKDPEQPDASPYRIIADEALIQFQHPFLGSAIDLAHADAGRIVSATLEGKVRIDGPHGLSISGRNFKFAEEQAQLYSDEPIEFQYGPGPGNAARVNGRAGRISLNLISATEPVLGDAMPLIAGFASLRLNKSIELHFYYEQKGAPAQASIHCSGDFEFDFRLHEATFRENVHIRQMADALRPERVTARMEGDSLLLNFEPMAEENLAGGAHAPSTASGIGRGSVALPDGLDRLQFTGLKAFGRVDRQGQVESKAIVRSEESNVTAAAEEISYNAATRQLEMTDRRGVQIDHGSTTFFSPVMRAQQDEQGQLVRLDCQGAGRLVHRDPRWGGEPLEGNWTGGVNVQPVEGGRLHRIELLDAVEILLPGRLGVTAQQLRLWVASSGIREMQGPSPSSPGLTQLEQIEAVDRVRLLTPEFQVRHADSILVKVKEGDVFGAPSSRSILQAAGNPESQSRPSSFEDRPLTVHAEHLELDVVHDSRTSELDVRSIRGIGKTTLQRDGVHSPSPEQDVQQGPFFMTGFNLKMLNSGDQGQTISLSATFNDAGDITHPAELKVGDVTIQGANLNLDRTGNVAGVNGPGRLQIPVNRDLNGQPLEQPSRLSVTWRESMTFDGQTARFLERVNTSLQDHHENVSTLSCTEMLVTLNRRILFSEDRPDTRNLQINRVHCRHDVQLDAYTWTGTELTGKRLARVAEFHVNQETGEFHGAGPGTIQVWSLGDRLHFAPAAAPQANRPADPRPPQWRYSNIRFAGQITGNLHQQQAEIQERVQVLSAPVENARDVFVMEQLDQPTEQSKHAALLNCDRLRITRRPHSSGEGSFLELLAYDVPELEGAVQLEGHNFWASANELSFDEQSETFILRGHGQDANLRFMDSTGKWLPPSLSRLITFNPSQRKVSFDKTSGVSGGF